MTIELETTAILRPDPRANLRPGDVTVSWCSKHWDRTDHLYTGNRLICLECYPEYKPTFEEQEKP